MIRTPLDPERWERAAEIFERALDAPRDARNRLIEAEAHGDADIIATVRGMLSADETTGELIEGGIDSLAPLVAELNTKTISAGDQIGDFEIISELGRGGMGVVYAARDLKLGRVAALKLLPTSSHLDPEASERLVAEAQAASALDHPNVATIYQVGETSDGRRFIAMARYEGETLREKLARGPIPPREAFSIARQIASGLSAAHAAGLIHRDVKPENIFLTRQGLAKLLDFGIATLASAERDGPTTRGTILYMSPEQVGRQTIGPASDVWSLGVVLFEMLASQPPYTGNSSREILLKIADESPVRMAPAAKQIPQVAAATLSHALEKDPTKRFRDATEFHSELARTEKLWLRPRRIRIGIAAAFVLVAGVWMTIRSSQPAAEDRTPPVLAVLPVTGDSSSTESIALASALSSEIAERVVGLGRMRLIHASSDSIARSNIRGLHLLKLTMVPRQSLPTIDVSLVRADTHKTLWTTRQAIDRNELRELSRDLVVGTLNAMGKPLSDRERSAIGSSFPASSRAYEEFLRGNQLLAQRTPQSVEQAMASFRRSADLDTGFAAAFARQSYAYSLLADWGWKPTAEFPGDPLTEGLALADRATRLDSTSADGWLARAYILVLKDPLRFTGAVEAFQHAIALDPYNAEAFHQYGQTLMPLGRYSEALAAYRRVIDLEPNRAMTLVPMAAIARRLSRRLEALRYLDSAIAAYPDIPYVRATRALLRIQLGDMKGARADADAAVAVPSSYRTPQLSALARVLWLEGDSARALATLDKAERSLAHPGSPSPSDAFWICLAEVTVGHIDKAVSLFLNTTPRGALLWFMFQGDELAEFRKNPEIAPVMTRIDPRARVQ